MNSKAPKLKLVEKASPAEPSKPRAKDRPWAGDKPRPNNLKLKPLSEQVIVITGATSGVGLATARAAAARGARLVLTARNEEALRAVQTDLSAKGVGVAFAVADVADRQALQAVADLAIERFGGFDTWINNAGVSIFGGLTKTPIEDQRRLFETNYWGLVNGSLIAAEHLKSRPGGGALINVGSALGDVGVPLQGAYSASKHAVKGFTQALRLELMGQRAPVSVTLIKPSSLDTPYKDHARNLTGMAVRNPPPVYGASLAAQAILHAAEHRVRELSVGGGGWALGVANAVAPFLTEPLLALAAPALSRDTSGRRSALIDNLYAPDQDLRERSFQRAVRETSLYTSAQMRPGATLTLAVIAGVAAGAVFRLGARQGGRRDEGDLDPVSSAQDVFSRLGLKGFGARAAP
ncbi:MAG TPA: SDR family oxidoreductase [Caulobacteraceae bacterium]|nr:SDR family oxidoreductase [Caulobacteraceae bacterium]